MLTENTHNIIINTMDNAAHVLITNLPDTLPDLPDLFCDESTTSSKIDEFDDVMGHCQLLAELATFYNNNEKKRTHDDMSSSESSSIRRGATLDVRNFFSDDQFEAPAAPQQAQPTQQPAPQGQQGTSLSSSSSESMAVADRLAQVVAMFEAKKVRVQEIPVDGNSAGAVSPRRQRRRPFRG